MSKIKCFFMSRESRILEKINQLEKEKGENDIRINEKFVGVPKTDNLFLLYLNAIQANEIKYDTLIFNLLEELKTLKRKKNGNI